MKQPARLLGMKVGTAMLLAMLSLPPSRALGAEGNMGDGNVIGTPSAHATPSVATLDGTYGKLPMSFEKNAGQSRSGADFIARGSGYSVFLTSGEAVLAVRKQTPPNRDHDPVAKQVDGSATIRMALVGSSPARVVAEGALPGKANYFIGNDPARWKRDVPTFAKVRYSGVYPGIDVLYYGSQRQLEYDFIVSPGSDPRAITLAFTGASVDIEKSGDLVLAAAGGRLSMHRPRIYQEFDGTKRAVSGGYVKRAEDRVGFAVGSYDTARPLVIDPMLVYSTYLGGSDNDSGAAIAVDLSGNAYVTGVTASTDFPTQDSWQATSAGAQDAFVAKFDPSGSLVYCTYLGGEADDYGNGIAVDSSGQAYVTGYTKSNDFPTTPGAYQTAYRGGEGDAFVAKLNPSGSALVYSTYLGGSGYDVATAIAVDPSGNAYVTGYNYLSDFPTTAGAYQTANKGSYDVVIAKLNPSGSGLVYSTYLGGSGDDYGLGIAVDASGNAYVTGHSGWSDFPLKNPVQPTFGGYYDAFVAKINPAGSAPVYSTYLGGSGMEIGRGVAVDPFGNAYVVGHTPSSNFPTTPGAYQQTFGGAEDAFVAKINSSGSALVYSTYLGGTGSERGNGIAVDPAGNAYVTGQNYQGGFPLKDPVQAAYHYESFEGFVTKVNSSGSALMYSTYLGGTGNDLSLGIAVDPLGNAYVVGFTYSTDLPTTPDAYQATNGGISDAFVAKIADGSTVGKVTGGGSIDVPGDIGMFGFVVQRQAADASIQGDLQYVNHASGTKVRSVTFTSFSIAGTTATFGGTCTNNGVPCTFTVDVADTGEPGAADTFTISVSGGPTEGGTLRSGNIQIHQ